MTPDLRHAEAAPERLAPTGSWTTYLGEQAVIHWSDEACQILGLRPDATLDDFIALVDEPDRPVFLAMRRACIEGGQPYEAELRIRRAGELRWIHARAVLCEEATGKRIVGVFQDVTESRRAEIRVRELEDALALQFETSPMPMYMFDAVSLRMLAVNDSSLELYGYTRDEFLGLGVADLRRGNDVPAALAATPLHDWVGSARHVRKDGTPITVEIHSRTMVFRGRPARIAIVKDITQQERLEAQLRHAQKMEAVGRLAAGVSHDFNNVLMVIGSYVGLALEDLDATSAIRDYLEEVRRAVDRATHLTRRLLTFSRQQVRSAKVVDLGALLGDMQGMLRRVVREDIELALVMPRTLDRVLADPVQLEQVVMNLAVNARDAMPHGGRLTIELSNVELDERYVAGHPDVKPGPYVVLAVTDDGEGMTPEVQARVFEPFFTTKAAGQGTGLGLATVFGIVQQSGGHVELDSEPGRGTTFRIYLPRTTRSLEAPSLEPVARGGAGRETILVVEDDAAVRAATCAILRRLGYHVLEAAGGDEAVHTCERHPDIIHLLVSDVVMPQANGPELYRRLAVLRPRLKVIFISGYTGEALGRPSAFDADAILVQKPVAPRQLEHVVRQTLDHGAAC